MRSTPFLLSMKCGNRSMCKLSVLSRHVAVEWSIQLMQFHPIIYQFVSWLGKQCSICNVNCQKHKHFNLSSIILGTRFIVKTDKAPVIVSVSLHHKQCLNLWEIQHGNAEWCRAIIDICFFTVIISSWAPSKCMYYTFLNVRGQCPLWFWWHLCLWTWPA
jgi:hypothetical protein